MQDALKDIDAPRSQGEVNVVWLSQVNRYFGLGESLRETARRRWWDVLAFRLAIELEADHQKQPGDVA